MRIERHEDPVAYERLVTPLLMTDEARYNLELAIVLRLARGESFGPFPPVLLTVHDRAGGLAGAALMTKPFQALVSPVPAEAAPAVAEWFADNGLDLPGALGDPAVVRTFAATYAARTGATVADRRAEGVFRLTTLVPPPPVPGALRLAREEETALVEEWSEAFLGELDLPRPPASPMPHRVREGMVWLWDDGGPVSLAGCAGFTPNGARVGPVYTPPARRGRGYASAVTAGATRALLDRGLRYTFLYTDLANPTSNKIYRALGYEQVGSVQEVVFGG